MPENASENSSQYPPVTYRARAFSAEKRGHELEEANARLTALSEQWMGFHALSSLLLGRIRRLVHEVPAEELPVAIEAALHEAPPVNGREALREQIIDDLALAWVQESATNVNRMTVKDWLLHQKRPSNPKR